MSTKPFGGNTLHSSARSDLPKHSVDPPTTPEACTVQGIKASAFELCEAESVHPERTGVVWDESMIHPQRVPNAAKKMESKVGFSIQGFDGQLARSLHNPTQLDSPFGLRLREAGQTSWTDRLC